MIKIPSAFRELFDPYDYKVFYGGRNGAKSTTYAECLTLIGSHKPLKILCVREYMSSIKDSVKPDLDKMIKYVGLEDFYRSTRDSIVGLNNTQFIFKGIKLDPVGIKSTSGVDICWVEEAQSVSQTSWDILIPTIREEGSEIWISFNPNLKSDPVYKMFITDERPNTLLRKVTWRDNPFFSERARRDMEYDKKHDIDKYMHIWEGECRSISEASVFRGKIKIDKFEAPEDTTFYFGLDFGFSQDPLAFIRCYVDDDNRYIFIDKAARQVGLEIDDTPKFLEQVVPDCKTWNVTADSARPEMISHLNKRGFRIFPAKKGPGSVQEGVEFIKNYTIIIHESLQDVIQEFSTYSYKIDKHTNQILPKLQDGDDHYIDSLRYALEDYNRIDYNIIVPK